MANSIICRPPTCNTSYIVPCSKVEQCINKNLHEIIDGNDSGIPDFCAAVSVCTGSFLQTQPNYSSEGILYLTYVDGVLSWITTTSAYTSEMAQDTVGSILSPEFIYDDDAPSISISSINWNKITNIPPSTSVSQSVQSGDGLTTNFSIVHGFSGTPKVVLVGSSQDASGISYVTINNTHISIYYNVAPAIGVSNLIFNYTANL